MGLINSSGRASPFYAQNDDHANLSDVSHEDTLADIMTQRRERLNHIESKIEYLVEMKREIEEDLIRLGEDAHYNHANQLPNEVLSRVFILVARDHGPVDFPISKVPPQLALSHVCSHWRSVALRTSELWGNTTLYCSAQDRDIIRIHQRWLLRAGTFPVTLSIIFTAFLDSNDIANLLRRILSPLEVKRLSLVLAFQKFMQLSTISETTFSNLMELDLYLALGQTEVNTEMNDPHHLMARLHSVTFYGDDDTELDIWFNKLSPTLPWSQLRSITVDGAPFSNLRVIVNILRQIPMLQSLSITIAEVSSIEELTLPYLLDFSLNICTVDLDRILRGFTCPRLAKFSLIVSDIGYTTRKTFDILMQQYNMQNLREITFLGSFTLALSISSILRNAPMLRSLTARRDAVMDDQAITGISDGTLGRCLQRLEISAAGDLWEVLDMVAARKKKVDETIKNGCSWKDEISLLKEIVFVEDFGFQKSQFKWDKEKLRALKEAGITITLPHILTYTFPRLE